MKSPAGKKLPGKIGSSTGAPIHQSKKKHAKTIFINRNIDVGFFAIIIFFK
jgi:hypothetical protein